MDSFILFSCDDPFHDGLIPDQSENLCTANIVFIHESLQNFQQCDDSFMALLPKEEGPNTFRTAMETADFIDLIPDIMESCIRIAVEGAYKGGYCYGSQVFLCD